jgi:hypothetical protein
LDLTGTLLDGIATVVRFSVTIFIDERTVECLCIDEGDIRTTVQLLTLQVGTTHIDPTVVGSDVVEKRDRLNPPIDARQSLVVLDASLQLVEDVPRPLVMIDQQPWCVRARRVAQAVMDTVSGTFLSEVPPEGEGLVRHGVRHTTELTPHGELLIDRTRRRHVRYRTVPVQLVIEKMEICDKGKAK